MDEETTETVEAGETSTETTYTEEELAEFKALFNRFDTDGSDSIEPSELGNALRYIGCNPLDIEVEAMVAEADSKSNDNGRLEFSAFCDIIAKNRKTTDQEEEELKNAFRLFDKNGDGTIDREELKKAIKSVGMWDAMTEDELDEMMETADISGNGTIEYNELVRIIMSVDS